MDVAALKRQRAANKGRLTNIINYIKAADDDTPIEEFRTRLARVEQLMVEFTNLESQILSCDENEVPDSVYEDNYYTAVTGLNTLIRSRSLAAGNKSQDTSFNTTNNGHSHEVKLPRINIPPFSGDYREWQSFYDLFSSTIHDSASLSPVQKFQYLKGLLRGEAATLLRHTSITEANYIGALNKLKSRYDRKRHIINVFLRTFIEQPSITTANTDNIKRLMDTSDEVIRGLKALGDKAESRDHWLIFLLVLKLDERSKLLWAQHVADLENPEFSHFMDFLAKRIDTLETVNMSLKRPTTQARVKSHVTTENMTYNCAKCNKSDHSLVACQQLNLMDAEQRKNWAKEDNRCFNCLSRRHRVEKCLSKYRCQHCKKKHHTLLHTSDETKPGVNSNEASVPTESTTSCCSQSNVKHTILPTALVNILDSTGRISVCRALLDSGSQASFISASCVQRLGLQRTNARLSITGLGSSSAGYTRGKATFIVRPNCHPEMPMEALILSKITSNLPHQSIEGISFSSWPEIQLADPQFHKSSRIDVLIGADYFFNLLEPAKIMLNQCGLIAQKTVFGWVVSGNFENKAQDKLVSMFAVQGDVDLDQTLRRFWELESITTSKSPASSEESFCENHFHANVKLANDGRFIVNLPFKKSPDNLGKSLHTAIQRLRAMERRFTKEPEFHALYREFMHEYQGLHHMEEIRQPKTTDGGHYLPHHGVLKHSSTTSKLRVVFDGSANTSTGMSLNNCLAIGPSVQRTLYSIILRFREHKFVLTADAEKMYRQIKLADNDCNFQRIVWRDHSSEPIRHFRLTTVTYGLASSSFLATRVLTKIADDNENLYPHAANAIRHDMYVDDLMTGAETELEMMQTKENISNLLLKHGFNLRKWMSNSAVICPNEEDKLNINLKSISDSHPDDPPSTKVLGINWNPVTDQFTFSSNLDRSTSFTKRIVVSEASRLFDPLGWLAPLTILIKIFVQKLWAINLDWDDPLPQDASNQWQHIRSQLENVNRISIPRFTQSNQKNTIELHGFSDASQDAYGAVVFQRVITDEGMIYIHLITAKTKVAPIRQVSLPRLELCAAVLLANLISLVQGETRMKIERVYAWTDSRIVLDWLSSHPKRWNTFVGNRTSEILSTLTRKNWYHVPSADNPADCASRGLFPEELANHRLWWRGPIWLHESNDRWPPQQNNYGFDEEENHKAFTFTNTIDDARAQWFDQLMSKYSTITKLKAVLAYVLRFVTTVRKRNTPIVDCLTREELFSALFKLCEHEQMRFYAQEMRQMRAGLEISKTSSLKSLNPFMDKVGLIRVGGRLENTNASFSTKHPIILHPKSQLSRLLVHSIHMDNKHAGPLLTLAISRQDYWIPGCRNVVRQVISRCVVCTKLKAQTASQLMGNLPSCRVELIRPFLRIGVDYAGPILIHMRKGRGQRSYKSYICLFVCLSTKAIHLELVSDLSSDAFLGALKRFVSRRGVCQEVFSDNGTNFIGADRKLREEFNKIVKNSKHISDYLSRQFISWHFIPPSAPHFGGMWEAGVKATKYHLRRVIGSTILTQEEMITLLAEIESILNSRPLCSINSTDIDVLTPSHFLIGHAATKISEADITHFKPSHLSRWQMVQQLTQHFWRRWYIEYLTSLQPRSKWREKQSPVNVNDIVIIKDNNTSVNHWPLGRVTKLHPGTDGLIRVVTLKTKSGEITRPIHKICILPTSNEDISNVHLLPPSSSISSPSHQSTTKS